MGKSKPISALQDDFDKVLLTARAELDESIFMEEWRIGSTMTQDEAITYALMGPLAINRPTMC